MNDKRALYHQRKITVRHVVTMLFSQATSDALKL